MNPGAGQPIRAERDSCVHFLGASVWKFQGEGLVWEHQGTRNNRRKFSKGNLRLNNSENFSTARTGLWNSALKKRGRNLIGKGQ